MKKKMTAKERKARFIKAMQNREFGRCPPTPKAWLGFKGAKLADVILHGTMCRRDKVVVNVSGMDLYDYEIKYLLMVCRKLGFTPEWKC